ncbi:hypothetical protein [Actinocatenispora comari]|uniref:Uncharacterized protein n=1 Tax=Actinocatenispora comari TaxID=2807577 RepID=A0A8J4A9P5_9ACTN|nr:hypothetical protein [Actinocatenispora comari]GIL27434.1 hypothetical protein NUM_26880 [Actinocatenispora comari]
MTTLVSLAEELGISRHAVFTLAGNLIDRHGYRRVVVDSRTSEITADAERAIRAYMRGLINVIVIHNSSCRGPVELAGDRWEEDPRPGSDVDGTHASWLEGPDRAVAP